MDRIVKGYVTDRRGEPLIGVGVLIKGSKNGTFTDFNGKYEIGAMEGNELEFSCLGYETAVMTLRKSDKLNVILNESMNDLEEAVVVGYSVMKKSDLTGAVSSVKTDNLPVASNTSIAHMMSGRAAGVSVTQNSAQPGGGVEMLVRGAASTGAGNTPLYLIDGFPVSGSSVEPAADNRYSDFGSRNPLNSINPNDNRDSQGCIFNRHIWCSCCQRGYHHNYTKRKGGTGFCQLQRELWRAENCQENRYDECNGVYD